MGNKSSTKKSQISNKLLFEAYPETHFYDYPRPKNEKSKDFDFLRNRNNSNPKINNNLTPRSRIKSNIQIDLHELKATYSFINKNLNLAFFEEVFKFFFSVFLENEKK